MKLAICTAAIVATFGLVCAVSLNAAKADYMLSDTMLSQGWSCQPNTDVPGRATSCRSGWSTKTTATPQPLKAPAKKPRKK